MDDIWVLLNAEPFGADSFVGVFSSPQLAWKFHETVRLIDPDKYRFEDIAFRSRDDVLTTLLQSDDPGVWVIYGYPDHPTVYDQANYEYEVAKIILCHLDEMLVNIA